MKKLFVLIGLLLLTAFGVYASGYDDFLNNVNSVMNVIDRTDYTINRVKNRIPKVDTNKTTPQTTTKTRSNTKVNQRTNNSNGYQETDNSDMPLYQQNQGNTVQGNSVPDGNYTYNQDRTYKGNAKTLGELPAGVLLMDPTSVWNYRRYDNYSGEIDVSMPVIWRKLEDNHYSQGATLLLSDTEIAKYPFCHRQKGLRDWGESDLRRFLRTTFYTHLSQGFKNAVVNVSIPYADLNGKPKTIVDNLFLLSIVEWGLSDRANNGTAIKYYDIPNIYVGSDVMSSSTNEIGIYNGHPGQYTRTINKPEATSAGYSNEVFVIYPGNLSTVSAAFGTSIRPAVNLKSTTPVKGPYTYKFRFDHKIIYYVLDFDGATAPAQSLTPVK